MFKKICKQQRRKERKLESASSYIIAIASHLLGNQRYRKNTTTNELLFASFPLSSVVVEIMCMCVTGDIDLFIRVFCFSFSLPPACSFPLRYTEIDLDRTIVYAYLQTMTRVPSYI